MPECRFGLGAGGNSIQIRHLARFALQRLAYRFATRVVANSPAAAAILRTEGVPSSRVSMIPNGVDAGAYPERAERPDVRRVITVANLRPEKNHETLIAAAAQLAESCPNLRYQIVATDRGATSSRSWLRTHGVNHIVEFLGHREDVPALLAAADVFVLPSRSEAFPNGAIEAMAAGLPVVACAVGGLLDLVETAGPESWFRRRIRSLWPRRSVRFTTIQSAPLNGHARHGAKCAPSIHSNGWSPRSTTFMTPSFARDTWCAQRRPRWASEPCAESPDVSTSTPLGL